ncbi:20711_t:CDS:2, partial [Dentiscutata erythropus]
SFVDTFLVFLKCSAMSSLTLNLYPNVDVYQPSIHTSIVEKQEYACGFNIVKSGLKFAIENSLVDKFVGLISGFIENHTENQRIQVNTSQIENQRMQVNISQIENQRMQVDISQIENLKKAKHKGRPKGSSFTQESSRFRRRDFKIH